MSVRVIFFAKYTPESIKGIMGGSDRMAAAEKLMAAAGGTTNMISFTRGNFDIVMDVTLPNKEMMMGAAAMVQASGSMSEIMYLECVDGDPIFDAARSIVSSYTPANA